MFSSLNVVNVREQIFISCNPYKTKMEFAVVEFASDDFEVVNTSTLREVGSTFPYETVCNWKKTGSKKTVSYTAKVHYASGRCLLNIFLQVLRFKVGNGECQLFTLDRNSACSVVVPYLQFHIFL